MVKDTFFSTPVYYADLADAETLNEHLKKDIRAWQKQDPEGTVRSNVAQAGERISVSFNFYQIRRGAELRNPNRKVVVVGDLEPGQ